MQATGLGLRLGLGVKAKIRIKARVRARARIGARERLAIAVPDPDFQMLTTSPPAQNACAHDMCETNNIYVRADLG